MSPDANVPIKQFNSWRFGGTLNAQTYPEDFILAKPIVLFVDDEERIVNSLRLIFFGDYRVMTATSAVAGLELVKKHDIKVVVSDQRMPEMTGVEFLAQVRQISPASVRVLLTGYADLEAVKDSINQGEIYRYIQKPWDNDKLKETVAEAVKASASPPVDEPSDLSAIDTDSVIADKEQPVAVLVVDEDEAIYGTIQGLIERGRCNVDKALYASSQEEAARILKTEPVGVLVSDVRLGKVSQIPFLSELRSEYPEVVSIVVTQEEDSELAIQLINAGQVFRFLPKNVSTAILRISVQSALLRHLKLLDSPDSELRFKADDETQEEIAEKEGGKRRLFGFGRKGKQDSATA